MDKPGNVAESIWISGGSNENNMVQEAEDHPTNYRENLHDAFPKQMAGLSKRDEAVEMGTSISPTSVRIQTSFSRVLPGNS